MRMQFELKEEKDRSYFHLPALTEAGIVHGFLTKTSSPVVSDHDARKAFLSAFSLKAYIIMRQEHGDAIHVVRDGERPSAGDGLVLLERDVAGVIKTADCLPVILFARDLPLAAIVHAGWKGTALNIAGEAAQRMKSLGAVPESMGALIGPGIGPCCYEVGEDVAGRFRDAGFGDGVIQTRGKALFLDLKAANALALKREGISEIYDTGLCTSCRDDLFFSARKQKEAAGRQINFVALRG